MNMNRVKERNKWIWRSLWQGALVLLVVVHFALPAHAQSILQPATKGVVWNPGGSSTPTNLSQLYFVGAASYGGNIDVFFSWPNLSTAGGTWPNVKTFTDTTSGRSLAPGYAVGSAVVFNDLIYTFVAEYSGMAQVSEADGSWPQYEIAYWAASASDWMNGSPGTRMTVATGIATRVPSSTSPGPTPINAAATVWNGQIYVFSTPSYTVNWNPVVYTSVDGQNWSQIAQPNTPNVFSIINDAITVPTTQVPSLANVSGVSSSVILLVGSYWSTDGVAQPQGYVAYYDPGTNTFYPPIALPMPSIPDSGYSLVYANGYFGTIDMTIDNVAMTPNPCAYINFSWTPPVTAVLNVMAVTNNGQNTRLAYWYLDPTSGNWTLNSSGPDGCTDQIPWAATSAGGYPNTVAVAPLYFSGQWNGNTCNPGLGSNTLCQMVVVFAPDNFLGWTTGTPPSSVWGFPPYPYRVAGAWLGWSDYWVPVSNYYENLQPTTYEVPNGDVTADVCAVMKQMWQLIGVIAGPPPFDGSTFNPSVTADISAVSFGSTSTQTSQQQGSWSTNYSFGDTLKTGPPFLQAQLSFTDSWGATTTQGSANTFTVTMNDEMGTATQLDASPSALGQLGYVYMSGPVIQPNLYNAYSVQDVNTQLGYSQIAMVITGNAKLFYPYFLNNPSEVDQNSTGYGAFGLMAGSMSFPLSTDIVDWNTQPQWDYSPENIDTSSYTVLVGQQNQLSNPLQGGQDLTQSFTKSTSSFTTNSTSNQTKESASVVVTLPIPFDKTKNTTSMDVSQGYNTQSNSSSQIQNNLTLLYSVPEDPSIVVYPYLLQATSYQAPWVPTGYTGPLPWLLTWWADGVPITTTATAAAGKAAGEALATAKGPAFGRAPLPRKAWGSITGYAPPNSVQAVAAKADAGAAASELRAEAISKGIPRNDSYFVRNGKLAMTRAKGSAIPIAMTARDFNPSGAVSVTINKRKIPISPKMGSWKLAGKVWKYQSKPGVGSELVALTLNFGAKTWDLSVTRAALGWYTDPLNPTVTLVLNLNDRYLLSNRIPHSASYHWDADLSALKQEVWVSSIGVNKDYNGKGKVKLQGQLSDPIEAFGDFSVAMNGSQRDLRVTKLEDFSRKFENKRTITYNDGTAKLEANLSTGQWSCEIDSSQFPNPSPVRDKDGKTDLRLKIGGKEFFSKRISSDYYKMALKYGP